MICYTALSPHPPLLIPEIGGPRIKDVESSRAGMREMARQLVESCPETVIFLTPHGNVFSDAISALGEANLEGDFSNFGSRHRMKASNDLKLLEEIEKRTQQSGTNFLSINQKLAVNNHLKHQLDHGILVPFYYLKEAGLPAVPVLAISIGYLPVLELYAFGRIIRDASEALGQRVAIVASGDMSHHLLSEGPYEYHPDGPRFDALMQEMITGRDVPALMSIPETLRDNAGECGYRSVVIMLGALDGRDFTTQVFSYEGPFGVGYLVAGFIPGEEKDSLLQDIIVRKRQELEKRRQEESLPVRWARMILESYIKQGSIKSAPPEMDELKRVKSGAFVSLKKNGMLRGCIGTISPVYNSLVEEIAHNAVSAGTQDPRFSPVQPAELPDLVYSVDVLGNPEPAGRDQLDPRKYGVIVSQGRRRGLLLPDLEGVNTVEEQLLIALQKAGISPQEDYNIERFEVVRYY